MIAITGADGQLGRALVAALRDAGSVVAGWGRAEYDLDDPRAARRMLERDQPELVYHCAAWTDVDGCTARPELARRRNGQATAALATACADAGAALVFVSTNEVFDGLRDDGSGYGETDERRPANAYGHSKAAGEAAVELLIAAGHPAWIARSSWIFGRPGRDFPARIVAAADVLEDGRQLQVVDDEIGRPTFVGDLASALLLVPERIAPGIVHLANRGRASRFEWATAVLAHCRPQVELAPIGMSDYVRASHPPPWGVLDTTQAESAGLGLRAWPEALADYLSEICPA